MFLQKSLVMSRKSLLVNNDSPQLLSDEVMESHQCLSVVSCSSFGSQSSKNKSHFFPLESICFP